MNGIVRLRRSIPESSFFAIDRNGQIVLSDDKFGLSKRYAGSPRSAELFAVHSVIRDADGREFLESSVQSNVPNWAFVAVTPVDEAYRGIWIMRRAFIVLAVLLGAVLALLGVAGSDLLYRPVRKLLGMLRTGAARRMSNEPVQDEIRRIESDIAESYAANDELTRIVDESIPAYRDRFISGLCHGANAEITEIREKLRYFDISIDPCNLYVSLWRFKEPLYEPGTTAEWNRLRRRIQQQLLLHSVFREHVGMTPGAFRKARVQTVYTRGVDRGSRTTPGGMVSDRNST